MALHAFDTMSSVEMPPSWLVEDHDLLCNAVREAGAMASKRFHAGEQGWDKSPGHPVSAADLAVDAYLKETLLGARPSYGWLSEESPASEKRLEAGRIFIVDPIDGTRAFLKGRPEYTISVALVSQGRPISAAVFNPETKEFFEAFEHGGARRNGGRLAVLKETQLKGAKLLVSRRELAGFGADVGVSECEIEALGSIAYKIARVAAGDAAAVLALRPKSDWDLAAAHLLVLEAGGRITDATGAALVYNRADTSHPSVLAANPILHELFRKRVADAR